MGGLSNGVKIDCDFFLINPPSPSQCGYQGNRRPGGRVAGNQDTGGKVSWPDNLVP
jgi:hypothetical protein